MDVADGSLIMIQHNAMIQRNDITINDTTKEARVHMARQCLFDASPNASFLDFRDYVLFFD